jgi:hypothetical protein
MNQGDLRALRNPLLVLLVTVLAAVAAVLHTNTLLAQAQQQLMQQQLMLKDARTRLQRSGDEKEIIIRYLGEYQQLARSGFVGDEQRINWLDSLRLANQQVELFGIDYQISAQKPYVHANELNPGQLSLQQSEMKLTFRLLHEEDLSRFFSSLAQQGTGIFLVDQCTLRRIDNAGMIRFQPNLLAECGLSWITVKTAAAGNKP